MEEINLIKGWDIKRNIELVCRRYRASVFEMQTESGWYGLRVRIEE